MLTPSEHGKMRRSFVRIVTIVVPRYQYYFKPFSFKITSFLNQPSFLNRRKSSFKTEYDRDDHIEKLFLRIYFIWHTLKERALL